MLTKLIIANVMSSFIFFIHFVHAWPANESVCVVKCLKTNGFHVTPIDMMTSSSGNIFRVTGHLCGEFTGPGEFPTQRPVTRSFDAFFDLRLNKRLSKQPWGWWLPSWPLWRQCNEMRCVMIPPSEKVRSSKHKLEFLCWFYLKIIYRLVWQIRLQSQDLKILEHLVPILYDLNRTPLAAFFRFCLAQPRFHPCEYAQRGGQLWLPITLIISNLVPLKSSDVNYKVFSVN